MTFDIALAIALIIAQLSVLIALGIFIVVYSGYAYSSGLDVPYVPTPQRHYPIIVEALQIREGDVVYDLGSGDGTFLAYCATRFPATRFVGIERNPFLHMQALWKKKRAGNPANLTFRRENFYAADMNDATKIYAYLLTGIIEKLFAETPRPGVRLVSRAFRLRDHEAAAVVELSPTKGWHGEHLLYVYDL